MLSLLRSHYFREQLFELKLAACFMLLALLLMDPCCLWDSLVEESLQWGKRHSRCPRRKLFYLKELVVLEKHYS